jgi:hypothetical protein
MPIYQLIIEKQFGTEFWVNDYYLDSADMAQADSDAQPIIDAERAITANGVQFTKYRISTVTPNDGIFANFALNVSGLNNLQGDLLPLFNVLRVDITAVQGRGGRKYLRGVLGEGDITFNTIVPAAVSFFNTNYCNVLDGLTYLVKKDGTALADASVFTQVGMRQLRRGSKRRTTPII